MPTISVRHLKRKFQNQQEHLKHNVLQSFDGLFPFLAESYSRYFVAGESAYSFMGEILDSLISIGLLIKKIPRKIASTMSYPLGFVNIETWQGLEYPLSSKLNKSAVHVPDESEVTLLKQFLNHYSEEKQIRVPVGLENECGSNTPITLDQFLEIVSTHNSAEEQSQQLINSQTRVAIRSPVSNSPPVLSHEQTRDVINKSVPEPTVPIDCAEGERAIESRTTTVQHGTTIRLPSPEVNVTNQNRVFVPPNDDLVLNAPTRDPTMLPDVNPTHNSQIREDSQLDDTRGTIDTAFKNPASSRLPLTNKFVIENTHALVSISENSWPRILNPTTIRAN
ncbi:hypothetical protein M3Y98_00709600 [Aphelenchoides besseyi]|nr:hypothetical protein M3Y98_00709600 [Aphelenchoides besseyi]